MGVPRFWREQPYRYNLEGTRCGNCEAAYFPPRSICTICRRESIGKMMPYKMRGTGTVKSCTTVTVPAPGFESLVPYCMAIVELDEGPRLTAHITDCQPGEIEVGLRVRAVFRRIQEDGSAGVIYYGTKFVSE